MNSEQDRRRAHAPLWDSSQDGSTNGDRLRIALLYNLQHPATVDPDAPPDALADQDRLEAVQMVEEALRAGGHEVIALEADPRLLDTIRQTNPDICFNMARGRDGRDRLAHVPALLEILNIPYTGSGVLTHALSQDKAACKRIWAHCGLPTPHFQVVQRVEEIDRHALPEFPLFVKPLYENAGKGIDPGAMVQDESALAARVAWVIRHYEEPALVERFLPGREFSVGILGNTHVEARSPKRRAEPLPRYRYFPILETATARDDKRTEDETAAAPEQIRGSSTGYVCPAEISVEMVVQLRALGTAAFEAVGGLDLARVDFRCDAEGQPYLLEIDTMPILDPATSRFVQMAEADGLPFSALVNTILDLALARYHFTDNAISIRTSE